MQRGRFIFAAALALVASSAYAAGTPTKVVSLDFSKTADQGMLQINGNTQWTSGKLQIIDDMGSEASSAFLKAPMQLSDYMASFDMEVKTGDPTANPADAVLFLIQSGGPDHIGGGGGGAGFTRTDGQVTPRGNITDATQLDYWGYSYAVDFNAWQDNGIPNQNQIIGLDILGQRTVLGRTPYNFVNKGLIHYDVRVTPDTLTVFATGGTDKLANKVLLTQPKWFGKGFFNAPNPVYFGFTGGTGGAQMEADVSNLTIQTGDGLPAPGLPYPPPATPPAAGQ